jgi:hypothetical protein
MYASFFTGYLIVEVLKNKLIIKKSNLDSILLRKVNNSMKYKYGRI